jgi:hypothetical protein
MARARRAYDRQWIQRNGRDGRPDAFAELLADSRWLVSSGRVEIQVVNDLTAAIKLCELLAHGQPTEQGTQ